MHYPLPSALANTAEFTFEVLRDDAPTLKVVAFSGRESISELYHFQVELASDEADLDFAELEGTPCALRILAERGSRIVHGMIRSFQRTREGARLTHYAAEIVPCHWMLTRRVGCRIFQAHNCTDMSVPGIVQHVLERAGIPAQRIRLALSDPAQYAPREYVVQYRESDLNFISRLMEEEGIFYFFEHCPKNGHVMVLGDSPVAHAPVTTDPNYPFRRADGMVPECEHVHNVQNRREVQFGAVALDDFNFARSPMDADMECRRESESFSALEFHDFPGGYAEQRPLGDRRAQVRFEEFQCARNTLGISTTARMMTPGYTFMLEEHPLDSLNRCYLVTQVTHHGRQPQSGEEDAEPDRVTGYAAELRAIPADVPYRPARVAIRPTVQGTQTAIVVGPVDEEIYVDEFGRVKVQFHWDREGSYDEKSSCWIRVSQGMAGGEYGMLFNPRVGHEVIVDFLEGDPDRPIIIGRVYNADLRPPALPKHKTWSVIKTQSTKGGGGCNAIVFDDKKDDEVFYLHAEKDQWIKAQNDRIEHVGGDRHLLVDKDRIELTQENKHGEVRLDFNESVGGNKSLAVGGSVAEQFGGAHSESCGSYYLSAAKGEVVIESGTGITLKCGGNFVKIDSGGVHIVGAVVNINSGGSAGNGCGAPMGELREPVSVADARPGYDRSYNRNQTETEDAPGGGEAAEAETTEPEKKTSWIEIELVDEAGQPWPGEPYEVLTDEGEKITGLLDQNGQAHVKLSKPSVPKISFPKLDQDAWERA